jgi:hypothetical protein
MQPIYTQTNYLNQYLTPQQLQFQQNKFVVHQQLRNRVYIQPTATSQRTVVHSPVITRTISNQSPMMQTHTVVNTVPQPMMRQVIQQQPISIVSHQSPIMQLPPPIMQLPPPVFPMQTIVHNQMPQTQTIIQQQQFPPYNPPVMLKQETVTIFEPRKEKDPPYLSMSCDGNRTTVDTVKGKFTEYKIIVETNIEEYMVENTQWKRYSDFEELHQIITQSYRHIVLPPMPSKHYFTQFDEAVIRERERTFDEMLNILCTDHSNTALINFLQKDS